RPEADDGAGQVAYRPHQPSAEPVVAAALPLGEQPGGGQLLGGEVLLAQVPAQVVPALGGVADAEALGGGPVEPPAGEELPGGLRLRAGQLGGEVLGSHPVRVQQPLPAAGLVRGTARTAVGLVPQLHPGLGGERLHRLGEGEVVDLLHEGDDVAALAAAEAVPQAQVRAHVEGGAALVVERAQALHRSDAGAAQRHVLADDLVDLGPFPYRGDVLATNEPGHGVESRWSACGAGAASTVGRAAG